jgi:hypothetical protein
MSELNWHNNKQRRKKATYREVSEERKVAEKDAE